MGNYELDPASVSEVFCIASGQSVTGAASFKIVDGSRIDVGKYDHVLLIVGQGGGSTAGTVTFTPRESDSQTGPEFPLDGTNGAPDYRTSFANAAAIGYGTKILRVAGRHRFLNVQVTLAAAGQSRVSAYVIGYGKRVQDPANAIGTSTTAILFS